MSTQVFLPPQTQTSLPNPERVGIVDRVSDGYVHPEGQHHASKNVALSRLGIHTSHPKAVWETKQKPSAVLAFLMGCIMLLYRNSLGMFLNTSPKKFMMRATVVSLLSGVVAFYITQFLSQGLLFMGLIAVLSFLSVGILWGICGLVGRGLALACRHIYQVGLDSL